MRVAIVGGSGNISEEIVKLLLAEGHEVTCFNRGRRAKSIEGARVIHGDREDREKFEKAMQRGKFDAAIDMICYNAEQAASSVRAFRGVGHFIQCSTVCTYGVEFDQVPVPEAHPCRSTTHYGIHKTAADEFYLRAHREEGFPVTIIKPSTTYGPRVGLLRQLAWDFSWVDRLREGRPVLLIDRGQARHQFLHVRDAAPAFVGVLENKKCIGQTYHVVHPTVTNWLAHHRLAQSLLGGKSELLGLPFVELQKCRAKRFDVGKQIFGHDMVYDGSRLKRDVPRFAPRVSLREGMAELIEKAHGLAKLSRASNRWEDRLIALRRKSLVTLS